LLLYAFIFTVLQAMRTSYTCTTFFSPELYQGKNRITSVMAVPLPDTSAELVRCALVRDRTGLNRLSPTYRLYLQPANQLLLLATKVSTSRSTTFHLFDMSRGALGTTLSKKAGNYIGKISANSARTEYLLYTAEAEPKEFMAVAYAKHDIFQQVRIDVRNCCSLNANRDRNKSNADKLLKTSYDRLFTTG
jgi:hypothetical protein